MGGRIWVESEVDKGSLFAFAVPFEVWATANRPVAAPVGVGPEAPLPSLRILMAEDSPDNRTITLAYLEDTPYLVDVAETGAIACSMFIEGHYDLVLMDRQMPVMDSLAATAPSAPGKKAQSAADADHRPDRLRAEGRPRDLPGVRRMAHRAYLTKPIKQDARHAAGGSSASPRSAAVQKGSDRARRKITRSADQKIADRAPAFLEHCRQNLIAMGHALNRADFEAVLVIGHNMRGSGGAFGFQPITDIEAALEQAAVRGDAIDMRTQLEALSRYLGSIGPVPLVG